MEKLRLEAVKRFAGYDLQSNGELQQLASMAAQICCTPTALITLLDEGTQLIKVSVGTDSRYSPAISFCNYTIEHNGLLIVPDARADGRFKNNPLVTGKPHIRFYAGAPLITHDGYAVGSLCVLGPEPGNLNEHQQLMLTMLAKQVISIMELKFSQDLLLLHQKQAEEQKRIINEADIRLRSFFESSLNFHVLLGNTGEVLDYNKTAYDFIKKAYQKKLIRGSEFIEYLEPSFKDIFLINYTLCMRGQKMVEEGYTDYPELGRVWWEASFEPAYDNGTEIIGISYSIRNVTERKLFEQKILAQNQSLMRIAHIQAHECRGPLTTIIGMMNLIKAEDYEAPVKYLKMMETAINRLDKKIHEIIDDVNTFSE